MRLKVVATILIAVLDAAGIIMTTYIDTIGAGHEKRMG